LHIRTVAAILMWLVVILLLLNAALRLSLIFWISITLLIVAVLFYFAPTIFQRRKRDKVS